MDQNRWDPETYVTYARDRQRDDAADEAAAYYASAAFAWIGGYRRPPPEADDPELRLDSSSFGRGFRDLVLAVVCDRIAKMPERGRNRAAQGIEIVDGFKDFEPYFNRPAEQGLCAETIGDLKAAAGLDSHNEAYETAYDYYDAVDNPMGWQAEPEFEILLHPLLGFVEQLSLELPEDVEEEIRRESLTARAEYKRNHFEKLIDGVVTEGGWSVDRPL